MGGKSLLIFRRGPGSVYGVRCCKSEWSQEQKRAAFDFCGRRLSAASMRTACNWPTDKFAHGGSWGRMDRVPVCAAGVDWTPPNAKDSDSQVAGTIGCNLGRIIWRFTGAITHRHT